jgi:hypothetical protein
MSERRAWPVSFVVERGKCRELARALRVRAPECSEGERLRAVPTYPVVANHWGHSNARVLEELGVEVTNVVHGSEEYEYPAGPLLEGQRLRGEMRLVERAPKTTRDGRRMTALRFETELVDERTGKLAVRIARTVLELEGAA